MEKQAHSNRGSRWQRSWLRRPWASFLGVVLLALLMAAAQSALAHWRSTTTRLPGACWIWAEDAGRRPIAFTAARDFELSEALAAHAQGRLAIVADESYVVYFNSQYLGANSYRRDAAIDTYDVTSLLRPGRNRVVVQLRSQRGVGGLLADVRVSDPSSIDTVRPAVVTDASWQIFRRHRPALFDLEAPLVDGQTATVWKLSPTGRWRPSGVVAERPTLANRKPKRRAPLRMRSAHGERWIDISRRKRNRPMLGPKVLFDWGEPVEGYLSIDLPSVDTPPALVYFGDTPPDPLEDTPDHVMIPMPGIHQWRDLHPRRFRYVMFIGVEPEGRIEVRLVEPGIARQLAPPPPSEGGVFGLPPALRHTSVEEMVWERLRQEAREQQQAAAER